MAIMKMWGTRPIEGAFHFLVLTSLLLHFLDDCQWLGLLSHLGWMAALVHGAKTEGLRVP